MDIERIIDEIEQLEEIFDAPDTRPLNATDISAANRRHDEMLAHSPWFRLWQSYGVCCRTEAPVCQLPGASSETAQTHQTGCLSNPIQSVTTEKASIAAPT